MSGARRKAVAILVSGPSGQSVTVPEGSARSVSMRKSTAWRSCSGMTGAGSSGPSRPVLPCTCSAVTSLRSSGTSQPAKTGMSVRPASSQTMRALREVRGSGTLPATAVIPSTSSSGEARARRMATASSCPGSVSMMMRRAMARPNFSPRPRRGLVAVVLFCPCVARAPRRFKRSVGLRQMVTGAVYLSPWHCRAAAGC